MSTRSLVQIFDGPEILCNVYRQCDGYPSGRGAEVAEFLKDLVIVNGLGSSNPPCVANGAGCLAAQFIAHEKDGAGNVYLYPVKTTPGNCGAEWLYQIRVTGSAVSVKVYSVSYAGRKSLEFSGNVATLAEFCKKEV